MISNTFLDTFLNNLTQINTIREFSKYSLNCLINIFHANCASFFLLSTDKKNLLMDYYIGFKNPPPKIVKCLPVDGSLSGRALRSQKIQKAYIRELQDLYIPTIKYLSLENITYIISIPLVYYYPLGVINLFYKNTDIAQHINLTLLENISKIVSLNFGHLQEHSIIKKQVKEKVELIEELKQKNFTLHSILDLCKIYSARLYLNTNKIFFDVSWQKKFSLNSSHIHFKNFLNLIRPLHYKEVKHNIDIFLCSPAKSKELSYQVHVNKEWRWVKEIWLKEEKNTILILRQDITEQKFKETLADILYKVSLSLHQSKTLEEFYELIHKVIDEHIIAPNFFIGIIDKKRDSLTFPYFKDEFDPVFDEIKNISHPRIKSLSVHIIKKKRPLFLREIAKLRLKSKNKLSIIGTPSKVWMGFPLMVEDKILGVLAVQDYHDAYHFTVREFKLLKAISHHIALAIERKQTFEALRISKRRLSTAIFGGQIGLWERDLHTNKLTINNHYAKMLGYTKKELESLTDAFFSILHPEDKDRVIKNDQQHLEGKRPCTETEVRLRTKEGKWKWILTRGLVIERDQEGNAVKLAGTHVDISQLKKAEESKNDLQKRVFEKQKLESIATFTTGIAHNFNNLLQIITSSLRTFSSNSNHQKQQIKTILDTCLRGQALVKQLLSFAQEEKHEFEIFNLTTLLKDTINMFEQIIPQTIELESTLEPDVYILGDPGLLEHAVLNLLKNSQDALGNKGKITISLFTKEDLIYLEIIDNGPGIPEELQDKIFDPFFTTKEIGKGSGLGLASVYGIVKQHTGQIKIKSKLNEGTSVLLTFPLQAKPNSQGCISQKSMPKNKNIKSILVVDDESIILESMATFLKEAGYTIFTAKDGEEALIQAQKKQPDLIILDLGLPKMSGEEVLEKLRTQKIKSKIIVTSGYLNHQIAKNPKLFGAEMFLGKPYSLDKLLLTICQL